MRIVSFSPAASDWLELMEPGIAAVPTSGAVQSKPVGEGGEHVLFRSDRRTVPGRAQEDSSMDVIILPGEFEVSDQDALTRSRGADVFTWDPKTLKSAMDYALRLARLVGRLPVLMQILAGRERELRKLGSAIAAEQSRSGTAKPSALCLYFDATWKVFGNWAPDLVELAGGAYALLESGDAAIMAREEDLASANPDVLFVGTELESADVVGAGTPDPISNRTAVMEKENQGSAHDFTRKGLDALLRTIPITPTAYLLPTHKLFSSGPSLHGLIFQMAPSLSPGCGALSEGGEKLVPVDSVTE